MSFASRFANPFIAAERGYLDAVIEPAETRARIITALRALENKWIRIRRRNMEIFRCSGW